jgi:hypothetical protein
MGFAQELLNRHPDLSTNHPLHIIERLREILEVEQSYASRARLALDCLLGDQEVAHGLPDRLFRPERGERPDYSAHAVDQTFLRRLPPPFAETVLADPSNEMPSSNPRRRVFEGIYQRRRVRVVVVAGTRPPLVVTVIDLGRG